MKSLSEWMRETYEVEDGEKVIVRKDGEIISEHERGGMVSPELFNAYREWARGQ